MHLVNNYMRTSGLNMTPHTDQAGAGVKITWADRGRGHSDGVGPESRGGTVSGVIFAPCSALLQLATLLWSVSHVLLPFLFTVDYTQLIFAKSQNLHT